MNVATWAINEKFLLILYKTSPRFDINSAVEKLGVEKYTFEVIQDKLTKLLLMPITDDNKFKFSGFTVKSLQLFVALLLLTFRTQLLNNIYSSFDVIVLIRRLFRSVKT